MTSPNAHKLKIKDLGIDTYRENIIFMRADSHVCLSEGFTALTRVIVHINENEIIATINVVNSDIITNSEAGLSIEAMKRLGVKGGIGAIKTHLLKKLKKQSLINKQKKQL